MPEGPEVETVVRRFRPLLVGRRIVAFESSWPRQARPSAAAARKALRGRVITGLSRRAKHIVADLDDGRRFLVHLRMSGRLEWPAAGEAGGRHLRAIWRFEDGARLWFVDARKFGRIIVGPLADRTLAALGAEPLDERFTAAALGRLLAGRARRLKPLLLDQTQIAGLGNIYADEALFRARLHPLTRADALTPPEVRRLRNAIRGVLREGIRRQGTTIDWIYPGGRMQDYLNVYGREGAACRRCGAVIVRRVIAQRGTWLCPSCQPAPRDKRAGAG